MADGQRGDGQEQPLDQGHDHLKRQGEFSGSGRTDQGQAHHQESRHQRVAAAQAITEGQEQAQSDQQHTAERVVTQQGNEQQAGPGGQHKDQDQAQAGLERQRPVHRCQHHQRQHRREERNGQGQAEARRQAQRRTEAQAQRALDPRRALNTRRTSSSSGAETRAQEHSTGCLRQGRP
ncbi:hypothetical protein D9M73_147670 [compost metagenome]